MQTPVIPGMKAIAADGSSSASGGGGSGSGGSGSGRGGGPGCSGGGASKPELPEFAEHPYQKYFDHLVQFDLVVDPEGNVLPGGNPRPEWPEQLPQPMDLDSTKS